MSTDTRYDYDLFTIGAGSGGVRASRMSAVHGARVAVAEERYLGGTCVNVGCIPKKLLVYGSHFADDFEDAAGFGWTVGERAFDWPSLIRNKDQEIARLNSIYRSLLDSHGVELFESRARVLDPHTVEVAGKKVTAANILVATGGWPTVPNVPGKEHAITSNEAFHLAEMPRRVVIVGGGYIAVEFAGIFNGLGAEVTQLYRGPLFLRGFDIDVRNTLADEMRKKGIDLRFDADIAGIERNGQALTATLKDGQELETDAVMFATGRLPNTRGLGIEELGVELGPQRRGGGQRAFSNQRPVHLRPRRCHGPGQAHPRGPRRGHDPRPHTVQGRRRADGLPKHSVRGLQPAADRHGGIHRGSRPGALRRGGRLPVRLQALKHTLSGRDEKTMMKLIVERASDRVVGCHMVGADAGEIIQGLAVALSCNATKADFDRTIGIHPTAAEEFVTMREPVSGGD